MIKRKYFFGIVFLFVILISLSFISAYTRTVTSGAQYTNVLGIGGFGSTNSLKFDKSMCQQGGQDLIVQIVPFGCTPAVVRSDLLEEQDVQVLCQLGATQINPLIDIEAVDYMKITGEHSKEVRGVGYFPSQAALGMIIGELTSPILSNLGYVVITLKQQPNESAMPNYVEGNLTAKIRYDVKNSFGVGDVNFYLPVLNDEEWNSKFTQYSFWQGRGYLRALSVDNGGAQIAMYADDSIVTSGAFSREGRTYSKTQYSSFYLEEGELSDEMYLPGFSPCLATLSVRLDDLVNPETRVKLRVGSDYVEVAKGEWFLDNKCRVTDINKEGLYQNVKIYCRDDEKPITTTLGISPRVKLRIDGKIEEYGVGDWLFKTEDNKKSVYLGYVGSYRDSEKSEDLYVYLVALPEHKEKLSASDLASVNVHANSLKSVKTGASVYDAIASGVKGLVGGTMVLGKWIIKGEDFFFISFKNPNTGIIFPSTSVKGKEISINGYGEGEDRGILTLTEDVYGLKKAEGDTYKILLDGEETGLRLDESKSGSDLRLILEPDALTGSIGITKYGTFFSETSCANYENCPKFVLSTGGDFNPPSKFEEFFENLVGAEVIPSENKLIVYKAVFDDSPNAEFNVYYENAMKDFQTIDVSFADEQDSENSEETYGERALYEAISLAYDLNKKRTMLELCDEFKEKYSKSILYAGILDFCDNEYKVSSDELSSMEVSINRIIKKITFEGIYEPKFEEYGAELFVRGPNGVARTFNLEKNKIADLHGLRDNFNGTEHIKLETLDENYANIYISVSGESVWAQTMQSDTKRLELNNPVIVGGYTFTLRKINLEKSAKVSIRGNTNFEFTEANFGFKIGIEKRSFPLTPEKASRKIESLNNSIKDLRKASDALAGVVKVMKTACTVTGGWLTFKNLVANLGGKSIARQKVMQGADGWTEKCTDMVSNREYVSLDKCFLENSDKIDAEVNEMYKSIQIQNSKIKTLENQAKNAEGYINQEKFVGDYSSTVVSGLKNSAMQNTINSVNPANPVDFSNIDTVLSSDSWKNNKYSLEQLKEIGLYSEILQSSTSTPELKETAKERLYKVLNEVNVNAQTYAQMATLANSYGIDSNKIGYIQTSKDTQKYTYEGLTNANTKISGVPGNAPVAIVQTDSLGSYIFVLDNSDGTDLYPIKAIEKTKVEGGKETKYMEYQIYSLDGKLIGEEDKIDKLKNSVFQKYDEFSFKNTYKNPVLRYYEEGVDKGNPAIVPFDTKEGWYAATKPFTGSDVLKAYDDSGVVRRVFWVCNVGADGLEDFFNSAKDDVCEMFNLRTGQSLNQFPGLGPIKSSTVVQLAQRAIESAQKAYVSGVKRVRIGTETFNVGSPAVSIPTIQCQDFMSPKDCNLLFNVCDPVVCPSSRCDLGETYPVKDVIQSGIIGSILLCLPNAKENIYVPICLSGVQAGLDGFISVQESYRDCLQQNLDTGETVGICDEVYSIYMCDFFWKQVLPLVKFGVPKGLSAIFGENARGGGEYLGVQDALKKAGDSIDYFKGYYAANSWKAFKLRSTEEVGSEVCKSFPSVVFPGSGSFLDSLTEPDSPFQFTGYFEETVFTTATNPPLSHYKVFYHIYAGKDTGAYYLVSLRQGTGSSYYSDTVLDRRVGAGYIPVGKYATNTTDFTAPSGYKQLCISVNGQEDCNFKQVSSSFAVNYMSDLYIKEQTTTLVKTEAECISGTASLYSLLNPNLQSTVENIINPAIYENGIIRTCATHNPGLQTDPSYAETKNARWVSVGYCGDTNVKCWLDRDKVKEIVKSLDIENQILKETSENYQNTLFKQGNYLTTEQFKANMSKISDFSELTKPELLKRIDLINSLFNQVFFSNQKAQLFLLRGKIYGKLARGAYKEIIIAKKELEARLEAEAAAAAGEPGTPGEVETSGTANALSSFNAKYLSPEFRINDKNFLTTDYCYRYYNSKWQWADCQARNKVWRNTGDFDEYLAGDPILDKPKKVKEVIYSLQKYDKDYLGGLTVLMNVVAKDNNAELSEETFDTTSMNEEKIFGVKFSDVTYEPMKLLYFRFSGGSWSWQIDKKFIGGGVWQSVTNIAPGFNENQKALVNSLKGISFYRGAAILFDPSSKDIQKLFITEALDELPSTGTTISTARQKVLASAEELNGAIVPGDYNIHCSEALVYAYNDASCGLSNCIYSAKSGQEYNIVTSSGTYKVTMGTQTKLVSGKQEVIFITSDNCQFTSSTLSYNDMLRKILPGDRIDFVYDEDDGHGVIFISWVSGQEYKTARVFDWNGARILEGNKDSLGNICTSKDFYSTLDKYCKSYRYTTYDLSTDRHPVYRIWNPVILGVQQLHQLL